MQDSGLNKSKVGDAMKIRQALRVVYKDQGSVMRILSPKIERQLFNLLVVSAILGHSRFEIEKLLREMLLRTSEFYQRAKKDNIEFFQFGEWIDTQIKLTLFDRDLEFESFEKLDHSKADDSRRSLFNSFARHMEGDLAEP